MSLSVDAVKNLSNSFLVSMGFTVLSVIGGAAIVYFLILPLRMRTAVARTEVEMLGKMLSTMRADIKTAPEQAEKTMELKAKLDHLLSSGTLKPDPISNSLRMGAKSLMAPLMEKTGFKLDSVKEHPPVLLRLPAPAPEQLYARQPVEFVGRGSFDQIISFVRETEENHPLTILSGLVILSQPQTPECHKAVITFEWPIKQVWLPSGTVRQR